MMIRMMKKSRIILTVVCAVMVMVLAAGCSQDQETPIPVDLSAANEEEAGENPVQGAEEHSADDGRSAKEEKGAEGQVQDQPDSNDIQSGQASASEELDGNVKTVGQDSFVICKQTTYSDEDSDIAVAPAPGMEEPDDLVTVYVNQNCSYWYETVRNGGVNPEDISEREGSFGDLKEGLACIIKGNWQDGAFYADSIRMMEFV